MPLALACVDAGKAVANETEKAVDTAVGGVKDAGNAAVGGAKDAGKKAGNMIGGITGGNKKKKK